MSPSTTMLWWKSQTTKPHSSSSWIKRSLVEFQVKGAASRACLTLVASPVRRKCRYQLLCWQTSLYSSLFPKNRSLSMLLLPVSMKASFAIAITPFICGILRRKVQITETHEMNTLQCRKVTYHTKRAARIDLRAPKTHTLKKSLFVWHGFSRKRAWYKVLRRTPLRRAPC